MGIFDRFHAFFHPQGGESPGSAAPVASSREQRQKFLDELRVEVPQAPAAGQTPQQETSASSDDDQEQEGDLSRTRGDDLSRTRGDDLKTDGEGNQPSQEADAPTGAGPTLGDEGDSPTGAGPTLGEDGGPQNGDDDALSL